jgi:hypothetical protein
VFRPPLNRHFKIEWGNLDALSFRVLDRFAGVNGEEKTQNPPILATRALSLRPFAGQGDYNPSEM